jgi:hypothetical protein
LNDISNPVQDTLSLTKGYGEHRSQTQNLITYLALHDSASALSFEKYLKSHSGKAFANKRLRLNQLMRLALKTY